MTPREADGVLYAVRRLDPNRTRIGVVGRSDNEDGSVTVVATVEGKGVVFLNWSILAEMCEKWAARGKDRARKVVANRVLRGPKLVRGAIAQYDTGPDDPYSASSDPDPGIGGER